jgi:glycosyltransferase involved in cell wall biosynthesis
MQLIFDNVFFFKSINCIGGVESFFYYLSKLFNNMVIIYEKADSTQVERMSKNVEVHKWHRETIKCKRLFGNYGLEHILPYVEAEEKYFIIHCDYKKNKFATPLIYPGFKYIAVSKVAGDSFKEMTGIDYELIYNPVVLEKPNIKKKPGLHLISATRLSGEKGGWRMDKLAEILDKSGIEYDWTIYSNKNKKLKFPSKNIILKEPKLDLTKEIAESSYLVQLSDHEAFGLSVCESLILDTPVIVTDIPAFHEIGCNEENAIFLDLNMSNLDINKILEGKKPFKYTPPKSNWGKYLDNSKQYDPNKIVEVTVTKRYTDIQLNKKLKRGDKEKMTIQRASILEAKGLIEW